jgi:hypothetical protein
MYLNKYINISLTHKKINLIFLYNFIVFYFSPTWYQYSSFFLLIGIELYNFYPETRIRKVVIFYKIKYIINFIFMPIKFKFLIIIYFLKRNTII